MIRAREEAPRVEPTGFASPAADYAELGISLDHSLIDHPEATFFFRATGMPLAKAGIFDGDLLVVDRSVKPRTGHIVVAFADGEFVLQDLRDLRRKEYGEVNVWGVVRWVIHDLCPAP